MRFTDDGPVGEPCDSCGADEVIEQVSYGPVGWTAIHQVHHRWCPHHPHSAGSAHRWRPQKSPKAARREH